MAEQTKNDKPNVLVIMSDEHGAMFSSVAGHPLIKTPNMERLAAEGVTFDDAYCNSPLCVPSRASFLTGKFVSNVKGGWDNAMPLGPDALTWPYLLRSQGYTTALDGKMHFLVPGALHGFQRQLTREPHKDNKHFIHRWRVDGLSTRGANVEEQSNERRDRNRNEDEDASGRSENTSELSIKFPPTAESAGRYEDPSNAGPGRSEVIEFDDEVETAALAYIKEQARQEEPFALCVGFLAPHFPFKVPEPYFSMYYPERTDLPNIPSGHIENLPPAARRLRQMFGYGPYTDDELMRTRAAYYGMITYIDAKIGRILDALEEQGLAENTLVIYTTDHGEMLGEHGLFRKMNFYEQSARVPLQMRLPGVLPAGLRIPQVVSLVDVVPTMLELCGVSPARWFLDGDSLLPLIRGDDASWKNEAFAEHIAHGTDRARAMIRMGKWKLCYGHGDPPELELYDLHADPGEFDNLADHPEVRDIRERLLARIRKEWTDPDRLTREIYTSQEERWEVREQTTDEFVF